MSSSVDSTPVSLLVRLRQPEAAEAWTRFVHLFAPLLDRWAHIQGLQDADAADVVQEVFCILVKRLCPNLLTIRKHSAKEEVNSR